MIVSTEVEMLTYLDARQFAYQRIEHPPVYTCEQADLYRPKLPAVSTKNLFLRDKHGLLFLIMTDCDKKLDLKHLGQLLHAPKLHFASPEKLKEMLGLDPGAVTVLGLVNDDQHRVQLWVDASIWDAAHFLCHPLVNTATLVISKKDLERFFELTGHAIHLVEM